MKCSKIHAILNRDGLILYQLNITQNKKRFIHDRPHLVNKHSSNKRSNHTTIFCKTYSTISKTNKDLTTNNVYVLCVVWTHTNIQSKASLSRTQFILSSYSQIISQIYHTVPLSGEIKWRICNIHNHWNHT